jgi:hypothetical protein
MKSDVKVVEHFLRVGRIVVKIGALLHLRVVGDISPLLT